MKGKERHGAKRTNPLAMRDGEKRQTRVLDWEQSRASIMEVPLAHCPVGPSGERVKSPRRNMPSQASDRPHAAKKASNEQTAPPRPRRTSM